MLVCRILCTEQAESFPTTKNAISNEFVVVFSNAGGRARGKATVSTFTANATAVVVGEYKRALHGLTVRGKPALVAALIANHPDDVLSIELNVVVRKIGTQAISSTFPMPPGLWGLDRIDQVGARTVLRAHNAAAVLAHNHRRGKAKGVWLLVLVKLPPPPPPPPPRVLTRVCQCQWVLMHRWGEDGDVSGEGCVWQPCGHFGSGFFPPQIPQWVTMWSQWYYWQP